MAKKIINNGDSGLVARTAINDNFTELYNVDALGYGFLPSATAAVNTAALQAAVLGGDKRIYIRAGTYEMDDTILLDDNTYIYCELGVVLKKTGTYCQVFLNRGALTKEWNENITIEGLQVEVNDVYITSQLVPRLTAHMAFYYIKNLRIKRFRLLDGPNAIYAFYTVRWEDVIFEDCHIKSEKDGINFGTGHDLLIKDTIFETRDDGSALATIGYTTTMVESGDIYNVTYQNCIDRTPSGQSEVGFFCRLLGSSWLAWANGNQYETGDLCKNDGNLYQCDNGNSFSAIGANAPVHTSGEVTGADTIKWRYLQDAPAKDYTEIYNIKFLSHTQLKARPLFYANLYDDATYLRAIYPGTEDLSTVYDVLISDLYHNTTSEEFPIRTDGSLTSMQIVNSVFRNAGTIYYSYDQQSFARAVNLIMSDNMIFDGDMFVFARMTGETVNIFGSGNYCSEARQGVPSAGDVRIDNPSLSLEADERIKLVPVVGDLVKDPDGLWIYKAGGWINLAV